MGLFWPQIDRNKTLRASSGNLTATETTAERDTSHYLTVTITLNVEDLVMPDADDEVDFYFQTKLNGVWMDVANVHFANAQEPISVATRLIKIGPLATGVSTITPTDGTLADNTVAAIPLGEAIRIKTAVTGASAPTYAYNAKVTGYTAN